MDKTFKTGKRHTGGSQITHGNIQYVQPVKVVPHGNPIPAVPLSQSYTPSYNAPKPSYNAPKPSYEAPKPAYGPPPKPSYDAPSKPSYNAPNQLKPSYKPTYKANPSLTTSGSSYDAPKPNYSQVSSNSAPSTGYNAPKPSYNAPSDSYGGPNVQDSYTAPKPSYNAPKPSYNAPKPSYNAPSSSYGAPSNSYGAPKPSYNPPSSSYGAPSSTYGAPSSYQAPKPSYNPPSSSYGSPGFSRFDSNVEPEYDDSDDVFQTNFDTIRRDGVDHHHGGHHGSHGHHGQHHDQHHGNHHHAHGQNGNPFLSNPESHRTGRAEECVCVPAAQCPHQSVMASLSGFQDYSSLVDPRTLPSDIDSILQAEHLDTLDLAVETPLPEDSRARSLKTKIEAITSAEEEEKNVEAGEGNDGIDFGELTKDELAEEEKSRRRRRRDTEEVVNAEEQFPDVQGVSIFI